MSAPATVARGKAAISGIPGAFDAILYAVQQEGDLTQQFEVEEGKDVNGYDAWWLFRNEHATFTCGLKLVGDTIAHSIIPATAVSTTAAVSALGQPFLAPGSTLVLTNFVPAGINGTYQLREGCSCAVKNTQVADLKLNLRKYANTDQTTAIATIPA